MNTAYVWNGSKKEFWIATGVVEYYGQFFLLMEDRSRTKKDIILLKNARLVTESFVLAEQCKKTTKTLKSTLGMFSLSSGDQPSLLIED